MEYAGPSAASHAGETSWIRAANRSQTVTDEDKGMATATFLARTHERRGVEPQHDGKLADPTQQEDPGDDFVGTRPESEEIADLPEEPDGGLIEAHEIIKKDPGERPKGQRGQPGEGSPLRLPHQVDAKPDRAGQTQEAEQLVGVGEAGVRLGQQAKVSAGS